jgi:hypothetical protein
MENKIILFIILFYLFINCINYSDDKLENMTNSSKFKYKLKKILSSF